MTFADLATNERVFLDSASRMRKRPFNSQLLLQPINESVH